MEYSINQLSKMAKVTPRTLRYYDEIGLLKPAFTNEAGYRFYGDEEVDTLQQILLHRRLGLELRTIAEILSDASFDTLAALKRHKDELKKQRHEIETLIETVEKTIETREGKRTMKNTEKFKGFIQEKIAKNEKHYGTEIREKYGDVTVNKSNEQLLAMGEADYEAHEKLGAEIIDLLKNAVGSETIDEETAHQIFEKHKKWITNAWGRYDASSHKGLALMYTEDPRFTAYYEDRAGKGAAVVLKNAIDRFA